MYFTDTPTLNSIEAIMKKLPYGIQKGGGRFRSPYKYTKKDCDCRLYLYYRKKTGCTATLCPVLDIRLSCGAASIGDAVKAVFKDAKNAAFQKRLSQIYNRKDDATMMFQSNRHKQIFETERFNLRKPIKKALARQQAAPKNAVLQRIHRIMKVTLPRNTPLSVRSADM